MNVVIVGGGIIGAALARHLLLAGASVTVLEAGPGATEASFGWVNASFFLNEDHYRLRAEGIEAWRRVGAHVAWTGCLCWEEEGAAFDAQHDQLNALGYNPQVLDAAAVSKLEPNIVPPRLTLRFQQEGVAEPAAVAKSLLSGIPRISGARAVGIATRNGRVTGVETVQGLMPADRVIVAAGTGSAALLNTVDVALPMLKRPGAMMRTHPVDRLFDHVLVAPGQEMRQDARGCILAPTAASHQGDDTEVIVTRPDELADLTLARLEAILPGQTLAWNHIALANRPVPQDGLPVIGPCGPEGLFAAVMHSGVTLAAVAAELVAPIVLDRNLSNVQAAMVAPYDPARFQSG